MATSARCAASASAAWRLTRSRSSATSISRASGSAILRRSGLSQPASARPWSQPRRTASGSGTVTSPGSADGAAVSSSRSPDSPSPVAARPRGDSSSRSIAESPTSDDAMPASSVASRSRSAATRARSSDSAARWRTAAASRPTRTAAIRNTARETTLRESEIVRWCRGSMKK